MRFKIPQDDLPGIPHRPHQSKLVQWQAPNAWSGFMTILSRSIHAVFMMVCST
jgi:hypothetical protein